MPSTLESARTNFSTDLQVESINTNPSTSIQLERIRSNKTKPLYQVRKKNKHEAATFFCKTIKDALDDEIINLIEPYGTVKLTSLIKQSFKQDKQLALRTDSAALEKYDFNSSNKFRTAVKSKLFVRPGSHNGYAILHIPAFIPVKDLEVPESATNFKISARLVCLSDFTYSEEHGSYVLKNEETHGLNGVFETTMLPVLRIQTQPITQQVRINQRKPIEGGISSVLVVAIKFYSYSKGRFTHLSESGSMKIMKVF